MQKYRVSVIQLALKNNKIAKSGDEVTEAQLTGNAADLVKNGFIEKVASKKEVTKDDEAEAEKTATKTATKKKASK